MTPSERSVSRIDAASAMIETIVMITLAAANDIHDIGANEIAASGG